MPTIPLQLDILGEGSKSIFKLGAHLVVGDRLLSDLDLTFLRVVDSFPNLSCKLAFLGEDCGENGCGGIIGCVRTLLWAAVG